MDDNTPQKPADDQILTDNQGQPVVQPVKPEPILPVVEEPAIGEEKPLDEDEEDDSFIAPDASPSDPVA